MAALFFDTHRAVKSLEEAGFEESQAEAVVEMVRSAIGDNVATSSDLRSSEQQSAVRMDAFEEQATARMDTFEERFTARMDTFEQNVTARMDAFEERIETRLNAFEQQMVSEIKALEARTRAEMKSLEQRMTIKLGAMVFAGVGIIIAFMAFFS